MTQPELLVGWDLDYVHLRHAHRWTLFSNETFGTDFTIDDYHEDWGLLWGVEPEVVEERKVLFFSEEILTSIEPMPNALTELQQIGKVARQMMITARRETTRPHTEKSVELHFPDIFETIAYSTFFDEDGIKHVRPKTELYEHYQVSMVVDDQPKHCFAAAEMGIPALLFGEWSWVENVGSLPKNVERAKNHNEVKEYVMDMRASM